MFYTAYQYFVHNAHNIWTKIQCSLNPGYDGRLLPVCSLTSDVVRLPPAWESRNIQVIGEDATDVVNRGKSHKFCLSADEYLYLVNCGLILYSFRDYADYLYDLVQITLVIAGGVGISFAVVANIESSSRKSSWSKQITEDSLREEAAYTSSFQYEYADFVNRHYDEMSMIFNEPEECSKYSVNCQNREFINSLREKENHFRIDLPYQNSPECVMFYEPDDSEHIECNGKCKNAKPENDVEDETKATRKVPAGRFVYYVQHSNVQYSVLNACARAYVLHHKCIGLFADDEEVEYMKHRHGRDDAQQAINDGSEKGVESCGDVPPLSKKEESEEDDNCESGDFESDDGSFEDVQKEATTNVFYNKNEKKKEKIQQSVERNCKRINRFVQLGTLSDYDEKYKPKSKPKEVDYDTFRRLLDKI